MKSAECVAIILDDMEQQEGVWQDAYEYVKDVTTADLADDCPEYCTSICDLKYDESTRHLMYADWKDFKAQTMADIRSRPKRNKPWHRWWRRKLGDEIQRCFTIFPFGYKIAIYEWRGAVTRIEYYSSMNDKATAFIGKPAYVSVIHT